MKGTVRITIPLNILNPPFPKAADIWISSLLEPQFDSPDAEERWGAKTYAARHPLLSSFLPRDIKLSYVGKAPILIISFTNLFELVDFSPLTTWSGCGTETSCTILLFFSLPPGEKRSLGQYELDDVSDSASHTRAQLTWENKESGRYVLNISAKSIRSAKKIFFGIMNGTLKPEDHLNWSKPQVT
jgi:hypothetical protein